MRLVVGLGNLGVKYANTRHNVGCLLVDRLLVQITKPKNQITNNFQIFKSQNFMNESGSFVKALIDKYKVDPSNLYIAHDDLDIKLGEYKIQFGKGPKVHNGVNSIETELGTKDFWRIRIGIENRNQESGISGEEYVLQDFTDEERKILDGVVAKICKETNRLLQ